MKVFDMNSYWKTVNINGVEIYFEVYKIFLDEHPPSVIFFVDSIHIATITGEQALEFQVANTNEEEKCKN